MRDFDRVLGVLEVAEELPDGAARLIEQRAGGACGTRLGGIRPTARRAARHGRGHRGHARRPALARDVARHEWLIATSRPAMLISGRGGTPRSLRLAVDRLVAGRASGGRPAADDPAVVGRLGADRAGVDRPASSSSGRPTGLGGPAIATAESRPTGSRPPGPRPPGGRSIAVRHRASPTADRRSDNRPGGQGRDARRGTEIGRRVTDRQATDRPMTPATIVRRAAVVGDAPRPRLSAATVRDRRAARDRRPAIDRRTTAALATTARPRATGRRAIGRHGRPAVDRRNRVRPAVQLRTAADQPRTAAAGVRIAAVGLRATTGRSGFGPPGAPARPTYAPRPQRESTEGLLGEDEELIAGKRPVEEAFAARREAIRLLVVPGTSRGARPARRSMRPRCASRSWSSRAGR